MKDNTAPKKKKKKVSFHAIGGEIALPAGHPLAKHLSELAGMIQSGMIPQPGFGPEGPSPEQRAFSTHLFKETQFKQHLTERMAQSNDASVILILAHHKLERTEICMGIHEDSKNKSPKEIADYLRRVAQCVEDGDGQPLGADGSMKVIQP